MRGQVLGIIRRRPDHIFGGAMPWRRSFSSQRTAGAAHIPGRGIVRFFRPTNAHSGGSAVKRLVFLLPLAVFAAACLGCGEGAAPQADRARTERDVLKEGRVAEAPAAGAVVEAKDKAPANEAQPQDHLQRQPPNWSLTTSRKPERTSPGWSRRTRATSPSRIRTTRPAHPARANGRFAFPPGNFGSSSPTSPSSANCAKARPIPTTLPTAITMSRPTSRTIRPRRKRCGN